MKYTALTIGPIYKTFQIAKSTKAIWAASYLFSYLMKQIIIKAGIDVKNVIIPYFENDDLDQETDENGQYKNKHGVGYFPDRLIVKGEIKDFQNIIDDAINEFAEKVAEDAIYIDAETSKSFFKQYFTFYHICVELDEPEEIILKINNLLDTAELKTPAVNQNGDDFLSEFLEKYKHDYNFLHQLEFGTRKFRSTAEIATSEFSNEKFFEEASKSINRNRDSDQEEFYTKIKESTKKDNVPNFKNYHKYIAIVQADGDNMGVFIQKLYTLPQKDELLTQFSKNLLAFGKEAVGLIKGYNGTPVYAGGDDLVFFAPVAHSCIENKNSFIIKTIFDLINSIDKIFQKYFNEYNKNDIDFKTIIENLDKKPSMSYGLSISYYKFPLNEATNEAYEQLFDVAKKSKKKDAVSFRLRKHSGQSSGNIFRKRTDSYKQLISLINTHTTTDEFVHATTQKLENQKSVILAIAKIKEAKINEAFTNFFFNNFSDYVKKNDRGKKELHPFLVQLNLFVQAVFNEEPDQTEKTRSNSFKKIMAALRFIHFINNKEER